MFKFCIVSIFFHLQKIRCNTLLRNMLFVLYLSHRILFLQPETETFHRQTVELKHSFLIESLSKDRLTYTHIQKAAANVCLCARPGAAVFSTETQWYMRGRKTDVP